MASEYYILADDGEPTPVADVMAWARWREETGEQGKRVAFTEIGEVHVSTVFLGLNHQWGDGPPLLFETMVFGGEWDEWQWRYTLRSEAQAGHDAIVAALTAGAEPDPAYAP